MCNYFNKLNIKSGPIPLPFFGNLLSMAKQGLVNYDLKLIKNYGRIVGHFEGSDPVIMCTDKDLIKNIMIKDFNKFTNRRV